MKSRVKVSVVVLVILNSLGLPMCACSGDSIPPSFKEQQQAQFDKQETQSLKTGSVSKGIVTGPDYRMCPSPCCGGWILIIDSVTYTFSSFPDHSGIDPTIQKFPLNVYLRWTRDTTPQCNHINVRWMRPDSIPSPPKPLPVTTSTHGSK